MSLMSLGAIEKNLSFRRKLDAERNCVNLLCSIVMELSADNIAYLIHGKATTATGNTVDRYGYALEREKELKNLMKKVEALLKKQQEADARGVRGPVEERIAIQRGLMALLEKHEKKNRAIFGKGGGGKIVTNMLKRASESLNDLPAVPITVKQGPAIPVESEDEPLNRQRQADEPLDVMDQMILRTELMMKQREQAEQEQLASQGNASLMVSDRAVALVNRRNTAAAVLEQFNLQRKEHLRSLKDPKIARIVQLRTLEGQRAKGSAKVAENSDTSGKIERLYAIVLELAIENLKHLVEDNTPALKGGQRLMHAIIRDEELRTFMERIENLRTKPDALAEAQLQMDLNIFLEQQQKNENKDRNIFARTFNVGQSAVGKMLEKSRASLEKLDSLKIREYKQGISLIQKRWISDRDIIRAYGNFKRAADEGYASAMYELGHLYEKYGDALSLPTPHYKNDVRSEACYYYKAAAEKGYVEAQESLSRLVNVDYAVGKEFVGVHAAIFGASFEDSVPYFRRVAEFGQVMGVMDSDKFHDACNIIKVQAKGRHPEHSAFAKLEPSSGGAVLVSMNTKKTNALPEVAVNKAAVLKVSEVSPVEENAKTKNVNKPVH